MSIGAGYARRVHYDFKIATVRCTAFGAAKKRLIEVLILPAISAQSHATLTGRPAAIHRIDAWTVRDCPRRCPMSSSSERAEPSEPN
jgi:hypothetical protein